MNTYCLDQISCYSICQVETVGVNPNTYFCDGEANKAHCSNPHPTTGTTGITGTTGGYSTTDGSTGNNQVSTTGESGAEKLMNYWTFVILCLLVLV